MTMRNMLENSSSLESFGYYSRAEFIMSQFTRAHSDMYLVKYKISEQFSEISINEILNAIESVISIKGVSPNTFTVFVNSVNLLIQISSNMEIHDFADVKKANFDIIVLGTNPNAKAVFEKLNTLLYDKRVFKTSTVGIDWYFAKGNGLASKKITIDNAKPIYKEFYPFIKKDIDEFIDEYWSSSQNLLVLNGPPGTGKTSFIRYMLFRLNKGAVVTYEEKVINEDEFFIDFIQGETNFLILEDADTLMGKRIETHNKVMSKLLNTSEGLIDSFIQKKKIILTANIENFNSIDDALVRPGRCFDLVQFRALTQEEIEHATSKNGLEFTLEKTATVAELFNGAQNRVTKTKIGF